MLVRIVDGIPNLLHVSFLNQSTNRTPVNALTAIGAHHFDQGMVEEGGDLLMVTLVGYRQGGYSLKLGAGPYTTLAPDTFAVVLDDGRGEIIYDPALTVDEVNENMIPYPVFMRQALQFAVPVLVALGAIGIMFRKQQLDNGFTGRPHGCAVGMDLHTLGNRCGTRCHQGPAAHLFNHTDPAVTCYTKVFMVTQCRNPEIEFLRRIEYGCSFRY
jgi:hypothetical protein